MLVEIKDFDFGNKYDRIASDYISLEEEKKLINERRYFTREQVIDIVNCYEWSSR